MDPSQVSAFVNGLQVAIPTLGGGAIVLVFLLHKGVFLTRQHHLDVLQPERERRLQLEIKLLEETKNNERLTSVIEALTRAGLVGRRA